MFSIIGNRRAYLLSFMDDGYQLKKGVVARLDRSAENGLAKLLTDSDSGRVSLAWDEVEAYKRLDPANARLRSLLTWMNVARPGSSCGCPRRFPIMRNQGLGRRRVSNSSPSV